MRGPGPPLRSLHRHRVAGRWRPAPWAAGTTPGGGGRDRAECPREWLDDALLVEPLGELRPQPRGVVGLADEVAVGNAAELVVRAGRHVRAGGPLAALQRDVAVLLLLRHLDEQLVEPVA